jgi:subtilase-type serine protease
VRSSRHLHHKRWLLASAATIVFVLFAEAVQAHGANVSIADGNVLSSTGSSTVQSTLSASVSATITINSRVTASQALTISSNLSGSVATYAMWASATQSVSVTASLVSVLSVQTNGAVGAPSRPPAAHCGSSPPPTSPCATRITASNAHAAGDTDLDKHTHRHHHHARPPSSTEAPRQHPPSGGPLTAAGGLHASLSISTINQIQINAETATAVHGAALSYWARLDLYTAATYFHHITGTLRLSAGDVVAADTIVGSGGTLTGVGTLGNVTVRAGGTLQPGSGAGTAIRIGGSLALQSCASYLVQVNATAAASAIVTGDASLAGKLQIATATGAMKFNQAYNVMSSHSVTGGFDSLVTPTGTTGSWSNTGSGVQVKLQSSLGLLGGLNDNQRAVGHALDYGFNRTGTTGALNAMFLGDIGQNLTQATGQVATGIQTTTFYAMDQFVKLITAERGGPIAGPMVITPAAGVVTKTHGMVVKAQPLAYVPHWSVWAAGFGGSASIDGDAGAGTAKATSRLAAGAVGTDYWFSPYTVAGFALAGGETSYQLDGSLGTGRSDLFQAGAFVRHNPGPAYITAALAYAWQDASTERSVTIAGIDRLRAEFDAHALTGRIEAGYRFNAPVDFGVTPYAAGQVTALDLPSYGETAAGGANTFALSYATKTVTNSRSELGLRTDQTFALDDSILTLRGRVAWAHDFDTERSVTAAFQSLPIASFVVNGARPAADSALTTASAEMRWANGFSLGAAFEGEFSGNSRSYAGKGVARFNW